MIRQACLVASVVLASKAQSQLPAWYTSPLAGWDARSLTTDSPAEHTIRALLLTKSEPVIGVIRPFPRSDRHVFMAGIGFPSTSGAGVRWVLPFGSVWLNTTRSHQDRDGAVWQGRGMTAALTGGMLADYRYVSVGIRPVFTASQNRRFSPSVPEGGALPAGGFNDPFVGWGIDLPYRFGDNTFVRLDPGESWVEFFLPRLSFGLTNTTQQWGPAEAFPLLMSSESGGYPRVFARTSRLASAVGTFEALWSVGRLESSGFDTLVVPGGRTRILPAVVATWSPRGFPGLELGAGRVFHVRWDRATVTGGTAMLPFKGLFKQTNPTGETRQHDQNQAASLFASIAPPGARTEVFFEFYREDHNVNLRDLIGEPDHASAYSVGFRRGWRDSTSIRRLSLELANSRISHIARVREQSSIYVHSIIREGHTSRGQPLGSAAVLGGGGLSVSFDEISETRSWTMQAGFRGAMQNQEGGTWNGQLGGYYTLRGARTLCGSRICSTMAFEVETGYALERDTNLTVSYAVAFRR